MKKPHPLLAYLLVCLDVRVNLRVILCRADKVSFAFKCLRWLSEMKDMKVNSIFKYYILLTFQCYILSLGFFKNNANKSDYPKDTPEG